MEVLGHHIYEYKKGLRSLVLHTMRAQDYQQAKEVLERTPYLAARFSGEFQMKRATDDNEDPRLDLALVPRPDAPDLDPAEVGRAFAEALAAGRGGIYAQVLADRPHLALPRVRFVRREEIMTPNSFKIRYLG